MRTVHCKGLLPTDVKGTLLKKKIITFLKEIKENGDILSILVFPDYSSLLKMQKQRLAIKDLEMINTTSENPDEIPCFQRCFPSTFNSLEEYERKFFEIEEKMQEEIEGIIESSCQCFLCFSNMKTAELCLKKFNNTSISNFIVSFFINLKNRCCYKRNENLERGFFSEIQFKRKISTFSKYSASIYKEEEEEKSRGFQPVMTIAPDPSDINWLNMGKSSVSFMFLRRILVNFMIFLIILFLTTPMALMQALEDELSMDWLSYIPHPFNEILSNLLPSLFVVLVNQLILLVIDYSSEIEKYSSFSGYQKSNLNKGLFYMLFNILILPVLTIGTVESLFLTIIQGFSMDLAQVLSSFYSNKNLWSFYLMILLEQGVLSVFFYVLRIKELILCVFNVKLAYYKRAFLSEKDVWRREVDDVFQYGYFSSQILVSLAIIMIFGYLYPVMIIAGLIYLIFRHIGDCYNLLVVNKKEMNSHGKFIQSVLSYSFIPLILCEILQIGSFFINEKINQMGFMGFLIGISGVLLIKMKKNLCTAINFEECEENKGNMKNFRRKWQDFYQHPLIIKGFERFREEEEIKREEIREKEEKEGDFNKDSKKKKKKIKMWDRMKIENLEEFEEY